jgi:hypothetical protein
VQELEADILCEWDLAIKSNIPAICRFKKCKGITLSLHGIVAQQGIGLVEIDKKRQRITIKWILSG